MKQYILSVMLVGLIGSVVSILAPEGGLREHVRLAVGIVTVAVCLLPLTGLVWELKEINIEEIIGESDNSAEQKYEEIFNSEFKNAESESLKEGIKNLLFEKYGIKEDECQVYVRIVEVDGGKRRLERIFINLYGQAIFKNTSEIEEYLGELFDCEVVIAVG